jgi:hypothetical protein
MYERPVRAPVNGYIGWTFGLRHMSKRATIFVLSWIFMFLCLGSFSSAFRGKEQISLQFKGQIMSAELQGVSLRLILERLKNEKGIWFKGDESALEESISIRFEDLPLHEGLRRILSNINHVLVFDRDKGLVGLFILGKKDAGRRAPRDGGVVTGKSPPSQPAEEATVSRDPFDDFPGGDHTGNPRTGSTDRPFGKDFSPLEDRDNQSGDKPFTDMSSGPESPVGESAAPSSENPFAASTTSSSEGPFDKGVFPSSKDPFADSFDVSPESQGGRR